MNARLWFRVLGGCLALATGACQRPPPPTRADTTTRADCRQEVERQYNAQNRADLTRRDERDFAFAGSYNSGIASRGLGAEYGRERMVTDCLRLHGDSGAGPGGASVGPALSPAERGSDGSSLRP